MVPVGLIKTLEACSLTSNIRTSPLRKLNAKVMAKLDRAVTGSGGQSGGSFGGNPLRI